MADEQPRTPEGQFASPEGQATPPADPNAPPVQEPQTYEVKVDGETQRVTLEEMQKGYMRQSTFTQRSQDLAERTQALEQARLQGGPQAGLGAGQRDSYGSSGPMSGGWPGLPAETPYPPEQPQYGTTAAQPPGSAPYGEPDDPVSARQLQPIQRHMMQLEARLAAQNDQMQRVQIAQAQEQEIGRLAQSLPGFDRAATEAQYHMLPAWQQARYQSMPKAEAFKLIHYEHLATPAAAPQAAPAGTPQSPGTSAVPAAGPEPPFSESARATAPVTPPLSPPSAEASPAEWDQALARGLKEGIPGSKPPRQQE